MRLRPPPIEKFFEVNAAVFNYATGLDRLETRTVGFSPYGRQEPERDDAVEIMPEGIEKDKP